MENSHDKGPGQRPYLTVQLLSLGITLFLVWLIYFKSSPELGEFHWSRKLPDLNAFLNTLTSCLLVLGLRQIKKGHVETHKKVMLSALFTSALFLISYILYHYFHGDTQFVGVGLLKMTYFFILISHIILSIINLPLILLTLFFAFKQNHEKHKKFAKITFPIWLYVSVSGVLVYLFLKFLNHS